MKRKSIIAVLLLGIAGLLTSCGSDDETILVKSITLSQAYFSCNSAFSTLRVRAKSLSFSTAFAGIRQIAINKIRTRSFLIALLYI